jgi:formylglycine-generating enzyme required for sulfatase activity
MKKSFIAISIFVFFLLANCAGKNSPHKEVMIPKAGDANAFLGIEKEAAIPKAGDANAFLGIEKEAAIPKAGDEKTFLGIEFVYIPSGGFIMGFDSIYINPNGLFVPNKQQKPVHKHEISKGFWISKYEITQKQYKAIMGRNPSQFKGDDLPVDSISWNDAKDFIKKLNSKGGGHFRLPTEAEWEYACRAGSETAFHFGDDEYLLGNYAWTTTNSGGRTHPVGQKLPNAWGLYDMIGNLWEWCEDLYDENAYKRYAEGNFTPPEKGTPKNARVKRGAAALCEDRRLNYSAYRYHSSYRTWTLPNVIIIKSLFKIYRNQGIRCVRDL